MLKRLTLFIFLFLFSFSESEAQQTIRIKGNTNDTAVKQSLPNALLMAIRFSDSTLVNFTRTNKEGIFDPIVIPPDTYIVIISHPNFNDKTYLLLPNPGDTLFNFRNVVLPPKSVQLNEVEIMAFKDKMYYKGDTLQFTADSFKVRPNATVEDLLKKLPGVKVDATGKITIQGKEVDQVLVDGDEFFGTDPTVATKNLNANTVETIQVYEKKNENADEKGEETVKIVNLKLKEDAKKGYFGKIAGASDFQNFYENELLANKFKNTQKISVFGLYANTPKQAFGWQDAYKYGIDESENGSYDPESNMWTGNGDNNVGIPQTFKTGIYYNDKIGKNTKLNTDYTHRQNQLSTSSEVNTQYFLEDTTYSKYQINNRRMNNLSHDFGLHLNTKLDTLTELIFKPKISYNSTESTSYQGDDFITQTGEKSRSTSITNTGKTETTDADLTLKMIRNFVKKDRSLTLNYIPSYNQVKGNNDLNTEFNYFKGQLPDSVLTQKRTQLNTQQQHMATVSYFEPITKKVKTEVGYTFMHELNNNNKNTTDYNKISNAYDLSNFAQSNNFRNTRMVNRVGAKLIYDVKKYRLMVGSNFRNIQQENVNLTSGETEKKDFFNVMPYANANFRFSQSSNLWINYNAMANQPDVKQLQPVIDNSDPNNIRTGNPDLRPEFTSNVSVNYYMYKPVTDMNLYGGSNFNHVNNEISDRSVFDSLGRSITTPININGNFSSNSWLGLNFPVFKGIIKINTNFNYNISNRRSYVNNELNSTETQGYHPGLGLETEFERFEMSIGGNYSYNTTRQSISTLSDQEYYSYTLYGNIFLLLPGKIKLSADGNYTDNGNRTPGYNLNYFILNASINKTFFKNENLILSIEGYDILNQNISNQRSIETNRIIDNKTQIIKRYYLLRLIYKFNSQKKKEENEFE